jgi:glycosyltransferase involved in cell wall biosynthesis
MAAAIHDAYGIDAEVVPPPPALGPHGPEKGIDGIDPGYFLCIARLLPYKNVAAIIEAVGLVPGSRLVVVGEGPERVALEGIASPNVRFTGGIGDATLRWLYRNATALVAASHEDYGLTPLEAATFGHPSVVLRGGGFLDTVIEGKTGVFFEEPRAEVIAAALVEAMRTPWEAAQITAHAGRYGVESFQGRIRDLVVGAGPAR